MVDTSVWISYFRNEETEQTIKLEKTIQSEIILIGDLILTEILQGISNDKEFKKVKSILLDLELAEIGGLEIALKSAENYRFLRTNGITIRKTIDNLIATFCIENDIQLLHNDRDFDPFENFLGLKVL